MIWRTKILIILLLYMLGVGAACTVIAWYTLPRGPARSAPLRTRPPLLWTEPRT